MRFNRAVVLLEAPTNLGLRPPAARREPGVRRLPAALRAHRLQERLGAAHAGSVIAPAYRFGVDRHTRVRNTDGVVRFSRDLARSLQPLLARGDFPLVVGGDCSLLLGTALALGREGPFGLAFVDGHQDLLTPETSHTGGAAGMDLALACGVGPPVLTRLAGPLPSVDPSLVLLIGDRSGDSGYPGSHVRRLRSQMFRAPLRALRRTIAGEVCSQGLARLRQLGQERVWLHLDVDVLDDDIMPAVDSRQPGGLSWAELGDILHVLLTSGMLAGMQVTILDPDLDPGGRCVEALTSALEHAFARARAASL
jgi:arginase